MTILHKATIVTGDKEAAGSVIIDGGIITDVLYSDAPDYDFRIGKILKDTPEADVWNLEGKHIMAGGIDAHVHFREPGLTHKADMQTESIAAAAGGVTSVFDMPNTNPATTSAEALKAKIAMAEGRVTGKIGFHIGATNDNIDALIALAGKGDAESGLKPEDIAGIKVFMGSSGKAVCH